MIRFILCALLVFGVPNLAHAQASQTNTASAGSQATTTLAAKPTLPYHACGIIGSIAGDASGVSGTQTLNLRDGSTGAGNVLFTTPLTTPASATTGIYIPGDWVGTSGNAMTLEFAAGGSNSSIESVTILYRVNSSCVYPPS